eukprot:scaffold66252_cov72-Phaeocystis_antarctica.AAC.2
MTPRDAFCWLREHISGQRDLSCVLWRRRVFMVGNRLQMRGKTDDKKDSNSAARGARPVIVVGCVLLSSTLRACVFGPASHASCTPASSLSSAPKLPAASRACKATQVVSSPRCFCLLDRRRAFSAACCCSTAGFGQR